MPTMAIVGKRYGGPIGTTSVVRVLWLDKRTGLSRSRAFDYEQDALTSAEALRAIGHQKVRVVKRRTPS